MVLIIISFTNICSKNSKEVLKRHGFSTHLKSTYKMVLLMNQQKVLVSEKILKKNMFITIEKLNLEKHVKQEVLILFLD